MRPRETESHAKAGQGRSRPGEDVRDRRRECGGMRAMGVRTEKGRRFSLTPEWWPEDWDLRDPTKRSAGLCRALETGSLVPVTVKHPPPGFASQLCSQQLRDSGQVTSLSEPQQFQRYCGALGRK